MLFKIKRIDGQNFNWNEPIRIMFKRNSKLRTRLNISIICKRRSELKTEAIIEIKFIEPKTKSEIKCIYNMLNNLRLVYELEDI